MTHNASPVPVSPLFLTVIQEEAAYGQIMPVKMILVVIKLPSKVVNLPQIADGIMVFVQLVVSIQILHPVLIRVVAFSSLMHVLMILVVLQLIVPLAQAHMDVGLIVFVVPAVSR
jgi:hypothetical protein